jgi:hypothetical protein
MRPRTSIFTLTAAVLLAAPAIAQQDTVQPQGTSKASGSATTDTTPAVKAAAVSLNAPIVTQYFRPQDKRGINVFEPTKNNSVPFRGFALSFGAAFSQTFQGLGHQNSAASRVVNGVEQNQLMKIGNGFNTASANLYVNAQLAPGIRVAMTSYLSSRHHNETWVKDGYIQIDESPIENRLLENVMKYTTIKVGHFEINYGDAHFRRSDNGNGLYNPFVGNLILDAFTTEVGAEVYVRPGNFIAMAALTGGEIKGNLLNPENREPAYIAKLGYDKQLTKDLRVRLTGSGYLNNESPANTLYTGDRAGSRYFFVLENSLATSTAQASSGLVNPGFRYKVKAFQVNPFVKVGGLELFGVAEQAKGRAQTETADRSWTQYASDVVYRFLKNEQLFVGARYNTAEGELVGIANRVNVHRAQIGTGWFITPSLLMKAEWVTQNYHDFPTTDIRSGGKFNGFMVEGVVAF